MRFVVNARTGGEKLPARQEQNICLSRPEKERYDTCQNEKKADNRKIHQHFTGLAKLFKALTDEYPAMPAVIDKRPTDDQFCYYQQSRVYAEGRILNSCVTVFSDQIVK